MNGRALDGARLYTDLFAALVSPGGGDLPASPAIAPGQAGAVPVALATAWLNWCAALLDDQSADAAVWDAQRMEYAFAVSAQVDGGRELTLAADAYRGDPIDWHTFDGDFSAPLGATAAPTTSSVCVVPSPVRFPACPRRAGGSSSTRTRTWAAST